LTLLDTDSDLRKTEKIVQHAKGAGALIAVDSNSRSSLWHDIITNERGRNLEEFLLSQQLYILNEESLQTTFRSTRGASNIDITITNGRLLSTGTDWEISDQESCSDHSVIRYVIGQQKPTSCLSKNNDAARYKVNKVGKQKFQENLIRLTEQKLFKNQNLNELAEMDNTLSIRVTQQPDADKLVDKFYEVLEEACRSSFQTTRALQLKTARRTVPWWSEELTTMRKWLNALRRRFQRTKDDELRTQCRAQYTEAKTNYASKIRKAKSLSWREYCNMTTYINPRNEAYRLAAGKRKSTTNNTKEAGWDIYRGPPNDTQAHAGSLCS